LAFDPIGPDTLSAKAMLLAALGAGLLLSEAVAAWSGRRGWMAPSLPELLLGALAVWGAASLTWALSPSTGFLGVATMVALPGVVRAVREVARDGDAVARWMARLVGLGLAVVIADGAMVLLRADVLATAERKYASWLFVHNNMAAAWAVMLAPLAAALALRGSRRLLWGSGCVALLTYLLVLRSRAGLAAALLGLGLVFLSAKLGGRLRRPGRRGAVVLSTLVLAGLALPFSAAARGFAKGAFYKLVTLLEDAGLGSLQDSLFRVNTWRRSLGLAADEPLFGVGAGNFMVAYSEVDVGQTPIPHAHNDTLQVLVELGLPGLALFLAFLAALVWQLLAVFAARGQCPRERALAAGLTGSLGVFVLAGFFEVPFALGATAANLAVMAGLTGALAAPARRLEPGRKRMLVPVVGAFALAALAVVGVRLPGSYWHREAREAVETGDLPAARQVLERMVRFKIGGHLPHQQLGELALAEGDWEAALGHFRSARRLWPHGTRLLLGEGQAQLARGRHSEALKCFRAASGISPGDQAVTIALVRALEMAGILDEAIWRVEYLLQLNRMASLDVVQTAARLYRRQLLALPQGPRQVEALVAARHFYAILLQDGDPDRWPEWNREFKDLTHQLQQLPRAPVSWWNDFYLAFLNTGGWHMPNTALWTSMDEDGVPLFPGWEEKAGPPLPRVFR
jgi:O-antigen ligase